MVLNFSNMLSSLYRKTFLSLSQSLNLKVSSYPLILGNIKTNGLMILSKYSIRYLELSLVSTNIEMTALISTYQIIVVFFFAP